MNTTSPELTMILTTLREFVTEEVIPLEPLLLNHDYDHLLPQLQAK